jgi:hypothetical protein
MKLKKPGSPPLILTLSSNIHHKKINRFNSLSSKKTKDMNDLVKSMNKYYKDMIYSPTHLDYNNINYLSKKGLTTSNLLKKSIKDSNQIINTYESEDFLEKDLYTPNYLKEKNNNKITRRNTSNILDIKKNSINKEINSYFDFDLKKDINEKNKKAINKLFQYNERVKKHKKLNQLKSEIIRYSQNKKYTTFKTFEKPIDRNGLSFYRDIDSKNFYSDIKSKYMDLYLKNPNKRNNDILNNFSLFLKTENPTKIYKTNIDIKRENSNYKNNHKKNKSIDIFQSGQINSTLNSTSNNSIITIYKNYKKKITFRRPFSSTQKSSMKNIFKHNKKNTKKLGNSIISHINDIQFEAKKESLLLKESYKQDIKYNKYNDLLRKSKSNDNEKIKKEKKLVDIDELNKEFKFEKSKSNDKENYINEYEIIRKNAKNVFSHLDKNGRKILIEVIKKMEYDDKRLHKKYIIDCLNDRRLFKKRMEKEFSLVAKESIALDKKLKKNEENINENEKELMNILRNILQKKFNNEEDLKEVIYRCQALKRIYLYEYRKKKESGKFNQEIKFLNNNEERNEDYYKRKSKSYNHNRTKSLS